VACVTYLHLDEKCAALRIFPVRVATGDFLISVCSICDPRGRHIAKLSLMRQQFGDIPKDGADYSYYAY
jgi:hypothetical protein